MVYTLYLGLLRPQRIQMGAKSVYIVNSFYSVHRVCSKIAVS